MPQIDFNTLLDTFAAENANAVKRALVAEVQLKAAAEEQKAYEELVASLNQEIARLRAEHEPTADKPETGQPDDAGEELVAHFTGEELADEEHVVVDMPKRPSSARRRGPKAD